MNMWKLISDSLIKVLREFGPIGVLTYVAGLVSLGGLFVGDFKSKILFGVIGIALFILAWKLSCFRMNIQLVRESNLVKMVMESNDKLSEKLDKDRSNEQVISITQTIWQSQKDLVEMILDIDLDELRKKEK
ncbi:MAG: hypothetical protein Q7S57_01160 [bacterium]|nr:hypothetical protein [bacterium]